MVSGQVLYFFPYKEAKSDKCPPDQRMPGYIPSRKLRQMWYGKSDSKDHIRNKEGFPSDQTPLDREVSR